MSVPDGAILKVVTSLLMPDSVIAQLVWAVVFADTGASNDEQDVVDDCAVWVEEILDNLAAYIKTTVTIASHKVYIYDAGDDDFDEVGLTASSWVGTSSATDMLPHGVAAICHAMTSNPDVIGTKYFPGFCEGFSSNSDWTGATVTAMLAAAADWVTAFVGANTGGDFGPGVWSPKNTLFYLMTGAYSANGDSGYQRRRKPGVGI